MSGWPLAAPEFTVTDRFDSATSDEKEITVTASGTAHTKGSWVELDASTSQDCYTLGVGLFASAVSGTVTGILVDIGIGASGSETVLIPNVLAGWKPSVPTGGSGGNQKGLAFPVFIPAGTRIAARAQSVIVSDTVNIGIRLLGSPNSFSHDMKQGGNVVTYGADTSNSRGTNIPEAAIHVKSSWVEFTASTTETHSALVLSVAGHTSSFQKWRVLLVDIGFGAAGSEQVLVSDIMVMSWLTEALFLYDPDVVSIGIGRTIPVGTRLAMRVQKSATGGDNSFCLHGVT